MTLRTVAHRTWTRVFVTELGDLERAEREIAASLGSGAVREPEEKFPLRFVAPNGEGARVTEIIVVLRPDEIITIEPGDGLPLLQDVEAELAWAGEPDRGPVGVGVAMVRAGFQGAAESLGYIEADIRRVRSSVAVVANQTSAARGFSVSDLPSVNMLLADIDQVLSQVSYAVGRLTELARLLRREAADTGAVPRAELDELIQQGEALHGRAEFLVDRHRFHARGTEQQIATSDLNIVKIFTVLWAILIPGTTLINWYGQNFEFMPELSWNYSSWVQILGVFVLAVLPIYTVKRAGQLR
ncbi:CorA family divalent cation transporter [Leucobacter luti]|uniref:Mg2+ and Co2+ transporter CorA n=1 Tax=Leucobacter luti TaxID=340320 RepID=A0A4Q7TKE0_9MICO|nr:CorA family divalent cation transporter [Leucobacter luti]MBL3700203.1 hypothetical protein [Leucobacter luti]RZT61074.1 Mg2+ and Co2+ transporter CorA [Leucobacter luti]